MGTEKKLLRRCHTIRLNFRGRLIQRIGLNLLPTGTNGNSAVEAEVGREDRLRHTDLGEASNSDTYISFLISLTKYLRRQLSERMDEGTVPHEGADMAARE